MKIKGFFQSKYKNLSAPVKAAFWFTICNVLQKGISLLTTPIFTRIMPTEAYGQYSVYQSWYTIISIFATLNLSAGVFNNGMVKWPDDRKSFTSSLQGLSTTVSLQLFIIYFVAQDFFNNLTGLSSLYMYAMFAEVLFVPAFNFWAAGQRFDYKYRALVAVTILIAISSPAIGVLTVISTEHKAEARVLSFVLVQVCVGLVFYILNAVRGKSFYRKEYWRFALAFNPPLIPHYLSQTILGQADRIMIARMVGNSEAAIYSVAYSISMMFNIVTTAVNNTFIPYTYKAIRDKNFTSLRKNASFLVASISLACILVMAFGPEVIRIFAAPNYYEARWAVPPVAMSLLFMFAMSLFGNLEFYYEKTKFIMLASSVAATANIILNYLAIPKYGYIAAGYTTLICYILMMIAHYFAYKSILAKKHEEDDAVPLNIYNTKLIFLISATSVFATIGMALIYDITIVRYLVILAISILVVIFRKRISSLVRSMTGSKNNGL